LTFIILFINIYPIIFFHRQTVTALAKHGNKSDIGGMAMKIAVTSTGSTLDDMVDPHFGRCAYFLLIDPQTLDFEAIQNPNVAQTGGAGIQAAQLMAEKGVSAVLTGNCGPNAFQVFNTAGIQVITGVSGQARQAVQQYNAGALSSASAPNVQRHAGMGAGRGMGGGGGRGVGGGGGRGMGGGGGRGMGGGGRFS
jgi:predicted Fe-Mo cluster-binding NifX family protein